MNWYVEALKKYAVFSGRARRKEYWYFFLFHIIIFLVLMTIDILIGSYSAETRIGLLSALYLLATLIPHIAVGVRRLHDTNRSGWWILIGFVPILGIVLLIFMVQDSQPSENQYGPNPKVAADSSSVAATKYQGRVSISPPTSQQETALDEERIYTIIAKELETGVTDKGLWTRLFAECSGDEKQTKVLYIKQRAERLIANERLRLEQLARESAERSHIEKLANAALGGTDVKNMDAGELYNIAYNLYDTKKHDKAEIICNYLFDKFPNSMQATWAKNIIGRIKPS